MKIAYFINQYPKVSHSFIRREILALERLGLQVERFALRGWNDESLVDPDDIIELGNTRFILNGSLAALVFEGLRFAFRSPLRTLIGLRTALRLAKRGARTWAHHLVSLMEGIRLCQWLRASGVSHVHAHFGTNSTEVVMLAHAVGGPTYSFTAHGPDEWDMPQQLKIRDKVRHSAFVVGISAFACSQLMRWSEQQDWGKVHQVHCGIGRDFFDIPSMPVFSSAQFVCVGRLCAQKAQSLLIDAVDLLRGRGIDVQLVLAGDGEDRPELEKKIHLRGLSKNVRITGWISSAQVREEILASRALIAASFIEGLPVVVMESLALRRPVIASWVAGIPELIRNGVEGWLVEPGSARKIAGAMEVCIRAPIESIREMGERGYERARLRHQTEDQASRLISLFRQYACVSSP